MIKQLVFAAAAVAMLSGQTDSFAQGFADLARELRAANPVADARRKVQAGDFRLIQITHAWAGPWLPGVVCLVPAGPHSLHVDSFHSDAIYGQEDAAYRQVEIAYATAFNREIVSHSAFPFPDVCRVRSVDELEAYDQRYLGLAEWRAASPPRGRSATLAAAARIGDQRGVERLLTAGADANQADVWEMTPLAWAALRGEENIARVLLAQGADPNVSCDRCATPLNLAVVGGSQEVVTLLVDAGAVLDRDSDGLQPHSDTFPSGTAIWVATALRRHSMLDQLLRAGADPNAISSGSATLRAIVLKDIVALRLLLAADADPNAHRQGVALIQVAAALNFPEGAKALLDAGAAAEARSEFEERMWRRASERDRDAILVRLIGQGAHLHLLPMIERDAVASAIDSGDEEALLVLLAEADRRWGELRAAITTGNLAETRRLTSLGSGVMRGHGEGELLTAIETGQVRIVEWLLANGADPDAVAHPDSLALLSTTSNLPTWTVADRSSVFGRVPYQYNAQTSPAMLAFNTGPIEVVTLVMRGVEADDRNLTDPENSYLDEALRGYGRHRDPEILERARLAGGAPAFTGAQGDQFLAEICQWTREDAEAILQRYLVMGYRPRAAADPEHRPLYPSDDPALSNCIAAGSEAAIMLLRYGADPNQSNSIGDSALWEALMELNSSDTSTRLVEQLLAAGADPNAAGERDPLTYAVNRSRGRNAEQAARFAAAAQLLRDHGARERDASITEERRPLLPIR